MKKIIIEDEKSAIEYIQHILTEWDEWKTHHTTLVQALEILANRNKQIDSGCCENCNSHREKQIEEITEILANGCKFNCCEGCEYSEDDYPKCALKYTADKLCNAGYRKSEEVAKLEQDVTRLVQEKNALINNYAEGMKDYAREIFEDLKRCKPVMAYDELIALKKKYLGENNNG